MIKLVNLSKNFGSKEAVSNLNLEIKDGEIFGLLGENGAGKTTTLRMLATMLKPTSGNAIINGYDSVKNDEKVRENIGILFGGETGLYDRLTARENIEYFANLYDMEKSKIKKTIENIVKIFNMSDYIDKRTSIFSKGMKQKTAFARATIHNPSILLLDEPTSGLDITAAKQVHDFIKSYKHENRTIIFSSHSMDEIEKLCDRIAIIHKGKTIEIGTLDEIKKKYNNNNLSDIFSDLISKGGNDYEY
ncbi:MAG: ATP-binding cassette domain-containing protein [Clostridia bacterium]|nr:ATP-binding cassette domain-containing protein [Clostridia bacterium]